MIMKTTRQYESKKLKFLFVKSVQSEGGADCVTLSTPPCTARLERQIHEWTGTFLNGSVLLT